MLYFQAKKNITAGKSYFKHCFLKFVMFHSYQITEVIDKWNFAKDRNHKRQFGKKLFASQESLFIKSSFLKGILRTFLHSSWQIIKGFWVSLKVTRGKVIRRIANMGLAQLISSFVFIPSPDNKQQRNGLNVTFFVSARY